MFSGSIPALVTPFRDGRFDEAAFRALVDFQIDNGSSALVPCGTTGESATMSIDEHNHVVAVCIDQARGRVPVIAGCGSNDTKVALEHMGHAKAAGAAAALVVLPYYNRPNQDGLIAHFRRVAAATDRNVVIYNIPYRTAVNLSNDSLLELAQVPNIVGVKDSSGSIEQSLELLRRKPADFAVLTGDASLRRRSMKRVTDSLAAMGA